MNLCVRFDVAEASHLLDDKSEVDALKKRITLDNFDPYEVSVCKYMRTYTHTHTHTSNICKYTHTHTLVDHRVHVCTCTTNLKWQDFKHIVQDEYDDTYDTHNVGAADADSADEMLSVKRSIEYIILQAIIIIARVILG